MHFVPALLLTTALLAPGLVRGDSGAPIHDPRAAHATTDENSDGEIDHEEFHHRMVEIFFFADTDKDGFVTRGQLVVFDEPQLFVRADKNGDGKLAIHELIQARFYDFQKVDTDASGTLSVEEVVDYVEQ